MAILGGLLMAAPIQQAVAADVRADAALQALANARLAEASGKPQSALAALAVVASHSPGLPGLDERLLESALLTGDLVVARSAAARLWQDGDRRIGVRIALLSDALRRSDWAGARLYVEQAEDKTGRDPVARLILPVLSAWVGVAMREHRPESMLLSQASGQSSASASVFGLEAALIQLASRRPTDALTQISGVSLDDPGAQMLALRVAATLESGGLTDAAADLRQRAVTAIGQRDDPMLLLPGGAITDVRSGIAHWFTLLSDSLNRTPGTNVKFPLIFARAGQWIEPGDWQGRLALVEALNKAGQADLAISLLAGQRGRVPAVLALRHAELVAASGDMAAAIPLANAAVAAPDSPRSLLIRYADLLRQSGDPVLAMAALSRLESALTESDEDQGLRGQILTSKAELLIKDQRWTEAQPMLEQAVKLLPGDAATLNFAGYSALERRHNVAQAMTRIEAAWRLRPQSAGITDSLGWAYYVTGKTDKAVELLERAMRGEPRNPVIVEHLGDAYWTAGHRFAARYQWRAATLLAEDAMADRLAIKLRDGLSAATIAP